MCLKLIKWGVVGGAGLLLTGGLIFGGDLVSYARTSARSVQTAVKDAVPIEFELQRARDLVEQIIPEMHANVRLIAQEEVAISGLKSEIEKAQRAVGEERVRVAKLRDSLTVTRASYNFGGHQYSHEQVKEELARSFDRVKEAEVILAGKQRLMETREKSLLAAMQMLDRTRAQKARLVDQIASLDSQYRLVKAAAVGSQVQFDSSKLAQTEKLITNIKTRLDVAERVLTHEARFVQPIAVDVIDEKELIAQIDEYLNPTPAETSAVAMSEKQN